MKVLVIGDIGGVRHIGMQSILNALVETGAVIVHKTYEELEAERPKPLVMSGELGYYFDECTKIPSAFAITEPEPKHQPKGPRGRWGKLK